MGRRAGRGVNFATHAFEAPIRTNPIPEFPKHRYINGVSQRSSRALCCPWRGVASHVCWPAPFLARVVTKLVKFGRRRCPTNDALGAHFVARDHSIERNVERRCLHAFFVMTAGDNCCHCATNPPELLRRGTVFGWNSGQQEENRRRPKSISASRSRAPLNGASVKIRLVSSLVQVNPPVR